MALSGMELIKKFHQQLTVLEFASVCLFTKHQKLFKMGGRCFDFSFLFSGGRRERQLWVFRIFFNDTHAEWEPLKKKKKENNKRELTNSIG